MIMNTKIWIARRAEAQAKRRFNLLFEESAGNPFKRDEARIAWLDWRETESHLLVVIDDQEMARHAHR